MEFVDVGIEIGIFFLEKLEGLGGWIVMSKKENGGENSEEFCNLLICEFVLIVTCWKFRGKIYEF